ncbi:hypothetical protein J6590_090956, partial [Homalodisca vitripennis]
YPPLTSIQLRNNTRHVDYLHTGRVTNSRVTSHSKRGRQLCTSLSSQSWLCPASIAPPTPTVIPRSRLDLSIYPCITYI